VEARHFVALVGGVSPFRRAQATHSQHHAKNAYPTVGELEKDGVITRKIYAEVPPRVEYSLTEYGKTLSPILRQMCRWGEAHRDKAEKYSAKKIALKKSA
jgi:DNA-binding PadR family transcriptional regulator